MTEKNINWAGIIKDATEAARIASDIYKDRSYLEELKKHLSAQAHIADLLKKTEVRKELEKAIQHQVALAQASKDTALWAQAFARWEEEKKRRLATQKEIFTSKILGEKIKAERKRQKLTQEQLAGVAGVGVRFLRELEQGKETCQLGLSLKVLDTLGLSIDIRNRSGESGL